MQFTGERYLPEVGGEIRVEHLHRYAWVAPLCAGKVVLDVACGEGYGTALLARTAAESVGVDVSQEAVAHASRRYQLQSNARFLNASASNLPLADRCVDVVVSFETIEHLSEQAEMLDEIRRVLRKNGILVISSPNRPVYGKLRSGANEYHVHELDFAELNSLLTPRFTSIEYYGQRMVAGSAILADRTDGTFLSLFADDGAEIAARPPRLGDPVYFVAVCSNGAPRTRLRAAAASLAVSEKYDPIAFHHEVASWAQAVDRELAAARARIGEMQAEHERTVAWAQSLEADVETARQAHRASEDARASSVQWAKQLNEELAGARAAAALYAAEREKAVEWARSLESELNEAREHHASLHEEHERVARWAHGLDRELVQTRQDAGTAARAQRKAEQRAASLEARLAEQEEARQKSERELAASSSEIINWQERRASEARRANEAEAELEAWRQRAQYAEAQLSERDNQLTRLTQHREFAEARVAELSSSFEAAQLELRAKEALLQELQREQAQLTEQLHAASTALLEVTRDRQSLTALLSATREKSTDHVQSLALSRQRIERLREHVRGLSRPHLRGN